jgi:hypothetical protein
LLTAFATPAFRKHALGNGVAHVYEKPMDIDQLKAVIELSVTGT